MMNQIKAGRCGVRFNPPAIIVTYEVRPGKIHRRTMPLRNFNKHSGVTRVAEELKANSRHRKYLETVPLHQLEKLIAVMKDKLNGVTLEDSLKKNKELAEINPDEDLNKIDEDLLKRKKAIMDTNFERNRKRPGDNDFKYDTEVDFEGGAIESCEWDSDHDDNEF